MTDCCNKKHCCALAAEVAGVATPPHTLRQSLTAHEPLRGFGAAHHEAGHALAGRLVGGRVVGVTIDRAPAAMIDTAGLTPRAKALIAIAGPLAQQREHRHRHRLLDGEWGVFFSAVDSGQSVGCDHCRVVRLALAATCDDEAACERRALRWARARESDALALLDRPGVWAAILRLAGLLSEVGTVDGPTVERIVGECVSAVEVTAFRRTLDVENY